MTRQCAGQLDVHREDTFTWAVRTVEGREPQLGQQERLTMCPGCPRCDPKGADD